MGWKDTLKPIQATPSTEAQPSWKATIKESEPTEISNAGAFREGMQDVGLFGLYDEAKGATLATLAKLKSLTEAPEEQVDWSEEYKKARDAERAEQKAALEAHPAAYTAGAITGGIGSTLATGGALGALGVGGKAAQAAKALQTAAKAGEVATTAAKTANVAASAAKALDTGIKVGKATQVAGRALPGLAQAATEGAVYGFGASEKEDVGGMLGDTAKGAALGTAMAGVGKVLGYGAKALKDTKLAEVSKQAYDKASKGVKVTGAKLAKDLQKGIRTLSDSLPNTLEELKNVAGTEIGDVFKPSTNFKSNTINVTEVLNTIMKESDDPNLARAVIHQINPSFLDEAGNIVADAQINVNQLRNLRDILYTKGTQGGEVKGRIGYALMNARNKLTGALKDVMHEDAYQKLLKNNEIYNKTATILDDLGAGAKFKQRPTSFVESIVETADDKVSAQKAKDELINRLRSIPDAKPYADTVSKQLDNLQTTSTLLGQEHDAYKLKHVLTGTGGQIASKVGEIAGDVVHSMKGLPSVAKPLAATKKVVNTLMDAPIEKIRQYSAAAAAKGDQRTAALLERLATIAPEDRTARMATLYMLSSSPLSDIIKSEE
jgi:hypothetical protein